MPNTRVNSHLMFTPMAIAIGRFEAPARTSAPVRVRATSRYSTTAQHSPTAMITSR